MIPLRLLTEESTSVPASGWKAWLSLGFRPFFLGAALWAVMSMVVWMAVYVGGWSLPMAAIPPVQWHAHEMLYGFAVAVIAGFLLTAVPRWVHRPTARGNSLLVLFMFWLVARVIALVGNQMLLPVLALLDLLALAGVAVAVVRPVVQARQWKQMGILAKLISLGVGNTLFYAGAMGWLAEGMRWGIYLGLYVIVALILAMGRRIIPPFMVAGLEHPVSPRNWKWVDIGSMIVYVPFVIVDVFTSNRTIAALLALGLFAIYSVRLYGWYTPALWKKPLLWSLYVAYAWIAAGFLLYASSVWGGFSPYLAVHAFAMGGIGLITLSMMMRVSLGHTGRSVLEPPRIAGVALAILALGAVVRVVLPLLWPGYYMLWIAGAQLLWITAFGGFFLHFLPIWTHPEVRSMGGVAGS